MLKWISQCCTMKSMTNFPRNLTSWKRSFEEQLRDIDKGLAGLKGVLASGCTGDNHSGNGYVCSQRWIGRIKENP